MRKLAHVPIQTWGPNDLFEGWFSVLGGFKILMGNGPNPRSMPCLVACAAVYQDYYGEHYKKQNGRTCNNATETQTPRSR
jgi:hypothetical protein